MVYKIIGKFDSVDFNKLLMNLSQNFLCFYIQEVLYISLKKYEDAEKSNDLVKKIFKPAKLFFIEEINENNIKKQTEAVQQWCSDNFQRLEIQRYELERQDKLKQVWSAMDKIEEELALKLEQQNIETPTEK